MWSCHKIWMGNAYYAVAFERECRSRMHEAIRASGDAGRERVETRERRKVPGARWDGDREQRVPALDSEIDQKGMEFEDENQDDEFIKDRDEGKLEQEADGRVQADLASEDEDANKAPHQRLGAVSTARSREWTRGHGRRARGPPGLKAGCDESHDDGDDVLNARDEEARMTEFLSKLAHDLGGDAQKTVSEIYSPPRLTAEARRVRHLPGTLILLSDVKRLMRRCAGTSPCSC